MVSDKEFKIKRIVCVGKLSVCPTILTNDILYVIGSIKIERFSSNLPLYVYIIYLSDMPSNTIYLYFHILLLFQLKLPLFKGT